MTDGTLRQQEAAERWAPLKEVIIASPQTVPNLLVRCIAGILMQRTIMDANLESEFMRAVAICADTMRKSGRIAHNAADTSMQLTTLGMERDRKRRRQKDNPAKLKYFLDTVKALRNKRGLN